ncbi:MAG: response regulator [Defluviitaleaceae bacterium]|nr:response regulator [Defluviitaleaceae bacterium]
MQKTILVVDDSNTNLLKVREVLHDKYKVVTLSSATKMFSFLAKIKPDLIILDIEMPDMNGLDAARILKSPSGNNKNKNIPIIFLTATYNAEREKLATTIGAANFVIKPFTPEILLEKIANAINNA